MKKTVLIILLICFKVNAQNDNYLTSSYYCDKSYDLINFKHKKIDEFSFNFPTFNLDGKFQPSNDLSHHKTYELYKLNSNKKIKSIRKYFKYKWQNDKGLHAEILFNDKGHISKLRQRNGEIIENYYYDAKDNQIRKERVVKGDTISLSTFKYNKYNQVIENCHYGFVENIRNKGLTRFYEFDKLNRPIATYYIDDNKERNITQKVYYSGNQVIIENINKRGVFHKEEKYYSMDLYLISEKLSENDEFLCYDEEKLSKSIKVKFNNIVLSTFRYDDKGNLINFSYGGIEENKQKQSKHQNTYDDFGQLIRSIIVSEISDTEHKEYFEIEYY